jgi:hypothetical protein
MTPAQDFDWNSIRVTEVSTAEWARKKRRRENSFIIMSHRDAVAGFKALRCPAALVWCALIFRAKVEKSDTIAVPTILLRSWGVGRTTWPRVLARLARAGLIRVKDRRPKAAKITLVKKA